MVSAIIFAIHGVAAAIAFFRYKKEGLKEGALAVAFVAIIFSVGWTISTMLTNLLFTPEFVVKWYYGETNSYLLQIVRKVFNRDAISLTILTAAETVFYYFYLRGDAKEQREEAERET